MRVLSLVALLLLSACQQEAPRVYGTVERDRLTLTAPVGELIRAVHVHEGDEVKAGTLLLELDDTAVQARLALRRAELARAEAQLAELLKGARIEALAQARAKVSGAEATLTEAESRYERTARLYKDKVLTQADLDGARAARDTALAARDSATQALRELENGTRSEQLDQARAAVAAAEAQLALEQKALADLYLVAAQDALVDLLPWRAGDRVAAGTQLVGLLAKNRPFVRVYLPAPYLDKMLPGAEVNIRVDGRAEALTGKVRKVRSQPAYTPFYALNERDRAQLMYLTDIDLPEGAELPSGLAIEVELPQ
ncbi:HlyD family secretion protein [Shewanella cyperi]|uniref:HlyD family secretion protein n=1 Tax=Shewanella cyperi TaxID=2814292 RepID=UPI001A93F793|nr:HlyD family efflux transporter periplasmic adaptor subunit [Shewanella cyperi]QSX40831.1 HlyD family efflux transporter periplasmic adaptor subunit [Shewanella cyperi]